MTIEELQQALEAITGTDAMSIARKRAILELIYALQNQE